MSEQTVTLAIPATTYDHLKRKAEASGRTVQDEILEAVQSSVGELPAELTDALSGMSLLYDEELWQAARSRVSDEDADEIERLQHKRVRQGLSDEEERALAGLIRLSNRVMLVRAKAAVLLKERGHDVSVLLEAS